jgi:hypothetical protein
MGGFAAAALLIGSIVIAVGPEAHGIEFRKSKVIVESIS